MTQALEPEACESTFVAATFPPAVIRAVERIVRSRSDITEAHLAAMRPSRTLAATPVLVVVSEDASVVTTVERALRYVLKPHVRPKVVRLPASDTELPWIRGVGGELKRVTSGLPWWFLLFGI